MPLPTGPSRDQIWAELANSTYRNGGVNTNALNEMSNYIFGAGSYSRDAFGGYGAPQVSSLSATGGDGEIDVSFTLDDNGGLSCTFVVQYWVQSGDLTPTPYYQETLGSSSAEGVKNYTFSANVSNGNTYEVRVMAYNKFNNNTSGIPAPRSTAGSWDWSNTDTASPVSPQLSTPTLSGQTLEYNAADGYVSFTYNDNEDAFDVQARVDGGSAENCTIDCDKNVGGSSNPKEIRFSFNTVPNSGVEFRVRATSGSQTDSNWSSWESATFVSLINLPSCPL